MMPMMTSACPHHLQRLHQPIPQSSKQWQQHRRRADNTCSLHLTKVCFSAGIWLQAPTPH